MTIAIPRLDRSGRRRPRHHPRRLPRPDPRRRAPRHPGPAPRPDPHRHALRRPVRPDRTSRPSPCRSPARPSASSSSAAPSASGAGPSPLLLYLAPRRHRAAGLRRGQARPRSILGGPTGGYLVGFVRGRGHRRPPGRARLGPPPRRVARRDGHRQPRSSTRSACPGSSSSLGLPWDDARSPSGMTSSCVWDAAKLVVAAASSRPPGGSSAGGPDDR